MSLYPVIVAGGSGTRFWPLSRKKLPKQFLALASKKPLISDTAERLQGLAPLSRTYVVCGALHASAVRRGIKGLPAKNILIEPAARNTAPAIALATWAVSARDPEGILAVTPSDQHVANPAGFREALTVAKRLAEAGHIVTLGIPPTRPETGYGYIQVGGALGEGGRRVKAFREKPDLATAKKYAASKDFLWNAGIFVFRAQTMMDALAEHAPELFAGMEKIRKAPRAKVASALARVFPTLPNISIDYAVMEKAKNIAVVPGDFGWSDVGSFAALPEVRAADAQGNVVVGSAAVLVDCQGCVVVSEKRLLALVGLKDMVVVDAGDTVLVVPKAQSQDVRKVVDALKAQKLERYL